MKQKVAVTFFWLIEFRVTTKISLSHTKYKKAKKKQYTKSRIREQEKQRFGVRKDDLKPSFLLKMSILFLMTGVSYGKYEPANYVVKYIFDGLVSCKLPS